MIPIRKIGRFFKIDQEGYLINDTSYEAILPEFLPLLEAIVQSYQKELGTKLHSVYLRGTLARGVFAADISDVDTFALVHLPNIRWERVGAIEAHRKNWPEPDHFTGEIEMMCSSFQEDLYGAYPALAMQIKTQSLCLFGADVGPQIPPFRIGSALMLNYPWLKTDFADYQENPSLEKGRQLMKTLLRIGFELVMERLGAYTPDLYLCYHSFAQFYPEKATLMEQVLHNYLNPADLSSTLPLIGSELLPFLESEIQEQLGDL